MNVRFECKNAVSDWHVFRHINFERAAVFNDSRFTGDVHFQESDFNFLARFENVLFDGYVCFDRYGAATLPYSECFKFVSFKNSHFSQGVSFQNRHFSETTDFSGCRFLKAPQFHGARLHQDTNFAGSKFPDTSSEYAAPAYRTLKLAMEDVRAREEEANFYALEQKSLRNRQDTAMDVKITSWLYEAFSGYGRNFMLPLIWLLL